MLICKTCNERVTKKYVKAYQDAGFGLQHIECPHCGQTGIEDTKAEA